MMPTLLIETALKAVALLAVSAAVVMLLRRSAARTRVAVWTAALGGILLLPLAASVLPRVEVPLPLPAALSSALASSVPIRVKATELPDASRRLPAGSLTDDLPASLVSREPSTPEPSRIHLPRPTLAGALLALWLGGAAIMLARLAADWLRVRALLANSRPAPAGWAPLLAAARRDAGVRRPVRLRVCGELAVPATVGLLRPAILLPESADDWAFDRRDLVLRHELLHVARLDWAARMLAGIACAVHWFDPLAWWARRRLALEQELACDQGILAAGVPASSYAHHLLEIARAAALRPAPTAPVLEMARATDLEERIMAILNGRTRRRTGIAAATATALALLLVFPVLAAMEVAAPEAAAPPAAPRAPRPEAVAPAPPAPEAPAVAPAAPVVAALAPSAPAPERAPAAPAPGSYDEPTTSVRTANPRLSRLLAEIKALEGRLESQIEPIRDLEERMRPQLDEIEALGAELDDEQRNDLAQELEGLAAELEERMQPELEAMEAEMALLGDRLAEREAEDGEVRQSRPHTKAELKARKAERAARLRELEERTKERQETMEREIAPLQERLAERSARIAELDRDELRRIEELTRQIEPLTEEIQRAQEGMQPLIEEITELVGQVRAEMAAEVEQILRRRFEPIVGQDAPFAETAAALVEASDGFNIDEDLARIEIDPDDTREVVAERLGPAPRGGRDAFEEALEEVSRDLRRLEIRIDRR